jgi:hypothetical protein
VDYSFRHPVANYALFGDDDNPRLNAPISWDRMLVRGRMVDVEDVGFGQQGPDHWPGQRQMLARLDGVHGLAALEADWYTTYHGGPGFVSRSQGIDHFIHEGGDVIERLRQSPIHPDVEVAVLAGTRPNVPGILNEYTGPSDGVLFVESALDVPDGWRLVDMAALPVHHKELVFGDEAKRWIADRLADRSSQPMSPAERRRVRESARVDGARELRRAQATSDTGGGLLLADVPRSSQPAPPDEVITP